MKWNKFKINHEYKGVRNYNFKTKIKFESETSINLNGKEITLAPKEIIDINEGSKLTINSSAAEYGYCTIGATSIISNKVKFWWEYKLYYITSSLIFLIIDFTFLIFGLNWLSFTFFVATFLWELKFLINWLININLLKSKIISDNLIVITKEKNGFLYEEGKQPIIDARVKKTPFNIEFDFQSTKSKIVKITHYKKSKKIEYIYQQASEIEKVECDMFSLKYGKAILDYELDKWEYQTLDKTKTKGEIKSPSKFQP